MVGSEFVDLGFRHDRIGVENRFRQNLEAPFPPMVIKAGIRVPAEVENPSNEESAEPTNIRVAEWLTCHGIC